MFTCPVCGYNQLDAPPADDEICPSCGTHFGYHDFALTPEGMNQRHLELRARWLAAGAQWWSHSDPPPAHWDGRKQLDEFLRLQPEGLKV